MVLVPIPLVSTSLQLTAVPFFFFLLLIRLVICIREDTICGLDLFTLHPWDTFVYILHGIFITDVFIKFIKFSFTLLYN